MNLDSTESKPEASEKYFFRASAEDFEKIPGNPIAYWLSARSFELFAGRDFVGNFARAAKGLVTANNDLFVRYWHEVAKQSVNYGASSREEASISGQRWFPYAKGGEFRRWYGNLDSIVDWEEDGRRIRTTLTSDGSRVRATNFNLDRIFRSGVSWTVVTSGRQSFRITPEGFLFDAAAGIIQPTGSEVQSEALIGFLNSKVAEQLLKAVNPTLNLHPGYIEALPLRHVSQGAVKVAQASIALEKRDWDSAEVSWDFTGIAWLPDAVKPELLSTVISKQRMRWREMAIEMQSLDEENNRIFIEAYDLQNELSPEVPFNEITLTCNPHFRYGGNRSEEELEALLLADTMREFISYSVGCMFGRYSLDKPGLILANQGETVEDYLKQVPEPTFAPDVDNVIPFLDGDWFADDVTERFKEFLRVTFGAEHYEENLRFIEDALNVKGRRSYSIRDFFLNEFYDDHVRRYKKRPIYWMFSSPKGSFRALIYMHRYRPDTVSVVLNNYLREFRTKLVAQRDQLEAVSVSTGSSPAEKTRALRDLDRLSKVISELEDYEHDVLYPLALQQIEIDLDDGVKVNYPKFGSALQKIPGL